MTDAPEMIHRQEIIKLGDTHEIFNRQAVSKTVSKYYSDICGLRRTYHIMMSAIYGARPENPYWRDILSTKSNVNKQS